MRYLSLFSGAGGGDLAAQYLLGWECVGYVEWEDYPQRVLRQRQLDGVLDRAPIYGDIRAFVADGYAAAYTGMVDVITGGFPCQPFSVAGKRQGADDERNMWPATIATISAVRPRFAFLENVPGLVTSGYFGTILGDLAACGYGVRWRILSAAEVGAPHRRDRLWIIAHTNDTAKRADSRDGSGSKPQQAGDNTGGICAPMADAASHGLENSGTPRPATRAVERPRKGCGSSWWQTEPDVGRVANGVAARVDRLRASGNGQVPLVAATAWHLLTESMARG